MLFEIDWDLNLFLSSFQFFDVVVNDITIFRRKFVVLAYCRWEVSLLQNYAFTRRYKYFVLGTHSLPIPYDIASSVQLIKKVSQEFIFVLCHSQRLFQLTQKNIFHHLWCYSGIENSCLIYAFSKYIYLPIFKFTLKVSWLFRLVGFRWLRQIFCLNKLFQIVYISHKNSIFYYRREVR